ncbi:hypothetical protein LTR53_007709 [Teratosphaeriaceae sp. CCFEE 6253]|nr:hypothetical protein LTR53_007709 [Teratosphaeriaceae sp. CCFEE 6253]
MASGTTALDLLSVPRGDYHHEGFTTSGPLTHDVQGLSLRAINAVMLRPDVAFLQRALSPRLLSVSSAPCSAFSFTRRNLADFLDRVRRRPDFYTVHRHNVHEDTITAEVNEASGKATVWMSGTIAGSLVEGEAITEREWTSKFEWRWWGSMAEGKVGNSNEGRWVCIRLTRVSGSASLLGSTLPPPS